jgi:glutamine amidotransferase
MCRFTFYHGPSLRISSLVTEPTNSIIHQSYLSQERSEPLNGDGFGVAWYPREGEPGLFRSVTPAWNNANLVSLSRVVESRCILAHVRAATQVRSVSEINCHPFVSGSYAFMHNGDLGGFAMLRRALLNHLSDDAFARLQGQTDSEHLFALILDRLGNNGAAVTVQQLAAIIKEGIKDALKLVERFAPGEYSYLNLVLTDGNVAVASRFTTQPDYDGESLYWNSGKRYSCEKGLCRMIVSDSSGTAVLVSSERLSNDPGWEIVPRNHMLLIGQDQTTWLEPLEYE